jgi:hypothetical protein
VRAVVAGLASVVLLAGCSLWAPDRLVTLPVRDLGVQVPGTARVHLALWAAVQGRDGTEALLLQDDQPLGSLPAEVHLTYKPSMDQAVQPAPGWGEHLVYWLEAEIDLQADGTIGTEDLVLVPGQPALGVENLTQGTQWRHPALQPTLSSQP